MKHFSLLFVFLTSIYILSFNKVISTNSIYSSNIRDFNFNTNFNDKEFCRLDSLIIDSGSFTNVMDT